MDDAEMNEILLFEKALKKGLGDITAKRYTVIG